MMILIFPPFGPEIAAQSAGGSADIEKFEGDCKNEHEMPIAVYLIFYFIYLLNVLSLKEDDHNADDSGGMV